MAGPKHPSPNSTSCSGKFCSKFLRRPQHYRLNPNPLRSRRHKTESKKTFKGVPIQIGAPFFSQPFLYLLHRIFPLNNSDKKHDDSRYEKNVYKPTDGVHANYTQNPQYKENNRNCNKHEDGIINIAIAVRPFEYVCEVLHSPRCFRTSSARHLCACLSRFRQADCYGLFSTFYNLAAPAHLKFSFFILAHYLPHLFLRYCPIFCHQKNYVTKLQRRPFSIKRRKQTNMITSQVRKSKDPEYRGLLENCTTGNKLLLRLRRLQFYHNRS